ncbi:hypothetical protein LXL04_004586 [Taraxacum kok-saghyz]
MFDVGGKVVVGGSPCFFPDEQTRRKNATYRKLKVAVFCLVPPPLSFSHPHPLRCAARTANQSRDAGHRGFCCCFFPASYQLTHLSPPVSPSPSVSMARISFLPSRSFTESKLRVTLAGLGLRLVKVAAGSSIRFRVRFLEDAPSPNNEHQMDVTFIYVGVSPLSTMALLERQSWDFTYINMVSEHRRKW